MITSIRGKDGREFTLRIVWKGDSYGRDQSLRNHDRPIVEFHDSTYAGETFGPLGQFIGSYYMETLLDRDERHDLTLWTSVPEWTVPAAELNKAMAWIVQQVGEQAEARQVSASLILEGDA